MNLNEISPTDHDFQCTDEEYTQYYKVNAYNDIENGLGRTSILIYKGKVIGFISIAMGHIRPERDQRLEGKGHGNIPALLVSHLATHKDYERKGVATHLLSWAIKYVRELSKTVGCRIVMLNPEDDEQIKKFYEKRGFMYVPHDDKDPDAFYFDIKGKIK